VGTRKLASFVGERGGKRQIFKKGNPTHASLGFPCPFLKHCRVIRNSSNFLLRERTTETFHYIILQRMLMYCIGNIRKISQ
jgi:hypothetical protein